MESVRTLSDALLGFSATKADELSMLQVYLRAVVVYLVLIGYVRFAKTRTGSFRTSPGTLPFSATSPKAPTRSWSARARSTADSTAAA